MKLSEFKPTEEVLERAGKCTTAEEVEKLARECDVELTAEEISEILKYNSLKELGDEDLNLVTGGDTHEERTAKDLPKDHGRLLGRYDSENYIGQKVYIVHDGDTKEYYSGTLVDSYEDDICFWITERYYAVFIENQNDYEKCRTSGKLGKESHFIAKHWSLYLLH